MLLDENHWAAVLVKNFEKEIENCWYNLQAMVGDLIQEVRKMKGGVLITYQIFGFKHVSDGSMCRSRWRL